MGKNDYHGNLDESRETDEKTFIVMDSDTQVEKGKK